jgi:transcriptional regulator with XRE-family HTH domain
MSPLTTIHQWIQCPPVSIVTPSEAVAEEVRAHMARKRISQTAAARALGISQSSMSRRLIGASPFTVDDLYVLAGLFGVNAAELISQKASA